VDTTKIVEEQKLLRLMLSHSFWEQHASNLIPGMFTGHLKEIFTAIKHGHEEYHRDLSIEDVRSIYSMLNPAATYAAKQSVLQQLYIVEELEPFNEDIARDILSHMWRQETFNQIAQHAIKGMDGDAEALLRIQEVLANTSEDFIPSDDTGILSNDIEDIVAGLIDTSKWKFNIESLADKVPGVGPGCLAVIGARPETGKTGFGVSLIAGPGGFAWQGAKILYVGNEESGARTQARMVMAAAGVDQHTLLKDPKKHCQEFYKIRDNITFKDGDTSLAQVDNLCRKLKPDILFVDQLDKVAITGTYDKGHDRLREIYTRSRSLANNHSLALFGVSQISAEGEGKPFLNLSMLEGSKTGKGAEVDLALLIGKDSSPGLEDNPMRYINIAKNKLTGYQGYVMATLDKFTSTYRG
jgi:replicative DNA helicase